MTCLCDVHVKFIRPHYNNLKEWMANSNNCYIGRRNVLILDGRRFPEEASIWANPFTVGKDGDLDTVLRKYYAYITHKIQTENLYDELISLHGKTLGCWFVGCNEVTDWSDLKCHGQLLLYLINHFSK